MAWKPPVNYRASAVQTTTPEAFTIGADGVALLAEAPADPANVATPMVVTVGGVTYSRVTSSPVAGSTTFRVRSQSVIYADLQPHTEYLPILEFHAERAGLSGTCSYYRTGTVYTSEMFSSMIAFLRPLTGYASAAALPAPTTDATQRGCPGDMAFTTSGQLYFSDGTQWLAVAGGAGAQFSITKTAAADAAVQASYTRTASADAAVFLSGTVSKDVPADGVILAHQLATVAGDAFVDSLHLTKTVSADAAVKSTRTSTASADAALKFAVAKTASSDAVVDAGASSAVSYVGAGSVFRYSASTGYETVPSPTVQANDILVAFGFGMLDTPGWTRVAAGNANVLWRRATGPQASWDLNTDDGGGEGAPVCLRMLAFRGCPTTGSPIDATDSSVTYASASAASVTGTALSQSANSMLVLATWFNSTVDAAAVGGSLDTLIAGGSGAPNVHIGCDSTPPSSAGAQSAPSISLASAVAARYFLTFALKAA